MATVINLQKFTFNLNGFTASYSYKGENYTLTLDPAATCQLMQSAGLIEGFDINHATGEPVILFTDNTYPEGYGFGEWASLVVFYHLSYRKAQMMLERKHEAKEFHNFNALCNYMLQPLQATA